MCVCERVITTHTLSQLEDEQMFSVLHWKLKTVFDAYDDRLSTFDDLGFRLRDQLFKFIH